MTRSSTKKLFTPFKDPKREFRSSQKLLKTLSLNESRSPEFNLFSDLEEYSKEEVTETIVQYMSKTRADYGSGIARPKIDDKDSFELKGQFLKELRDNTFSGSVMKKSERNIRKVLGLSIIISINITSNTSVLRELGTVKYPKGIAKNMLVGLGKFVFLVDFIILDMPEDVKVPLILERPFLSTSHAKIDVFKRKITLRNFGGIRFYDLMPTIEEVVENMDGYRDQDVGDVILGEPFCKASCVEARRFDGLITIHNGSDNVTYPMARSHPRFKHLSNA
ncbi:reverse transcriptase domain-containing protein [Tanacetum coccineum]